MKHSVIFSISILLMHCSLFQQLIQYIIRQNEPGGLDDALHVIEGFPDLTAVDVYVIKIHSLIEHNMVCTCVYRIVIFIL